MTFEVSMKTNYDSKGYYAELFADILADVQSDDPETSTRIVEGFLTALNNWKEYHQTQAYEYESIGERIRLSLAV